MTANIKWLCCFRQACDVLRAMMRHRCLIIAMCTVSINAHIFSFCFPEVIEKWRDIANSLRKCDTVDCMWWVWVLDWRGGGGLVCASSMQNYWCKWTWRRVAVSYEHTPLTLSIWCNVLFVHVCCNCGFQALAAVVGILLFLICPTHYVIIKTQM